MALNLFETNTATEDGGSDGFNLQEFYSSPLDGVGFRLTVDKYFLFFRYIELFTFTFFLACFKFNFF